MRHTRLTQSGAPGRVIGCTSFSHWRSVHGFRRIFKNVSLDLSAIYFARFRACWASFVCSCYYILECYNLFSGVKLSINLFCFIYVSCFCLCLIWVLCKNRTTVYIKKVHHPSQIIWKCRIRCNQCWTVMLVCYWLLACSESEDLLSHKSEKSDFCSMEYKWLNSPVTNAWMITKSSDFYNTVILKFLIRKLYIGCSLGFGTLTSHKSFQFYSI